MTRPAVVCIVGKKKSGKTTVLVKLVAELVRRGRRVMTVKHGHGFDLDTPGRDSWRHRHEAAAERTVLASPEGVALVGAWPGDREPSLEAIADWLLPDAEIVVVEGFKTQGTDRIEVYRKAAGHTPVYDPAVPAPGAYLAGVSDDPTWAAAVPFPVIPLDDPALAHRLADLVEARLARRASG